MDLAYLLQVVLALIFVIGLIGASSLLYKRCVLDRNLMKGGQRKRLSISEQLYLDSKRRLVLVKKDEREFLILIGQSGETLINSENAPGLEIKLTRKKKKS